MRQLDTEMAVGQMPQALLPVQELALPPPPPAVLLLPLAVLLPAAFRAAAYAGSAAVKRCAQASLRHASNGGRRCVLLAQLHYANAFRLR